MNDLDDNIESIMSKSLPEPKIKRVGSLVSESNAQGSESQSAKPLMNPDLAAVKLQKIYRGFRTRRNLADSAVMVEQGVKLLDFEQLKSSSLSFFVKPETAVSRGAAKVGKGLSKNEKASKLALQHWLEAIDPRHRYGHNLHYYYTKWLLSESTQPFFYWLDVGEGKEVNLEICPRTKLLQQCIIYLGPKEREAYEVIVEDGKFMYKLSKTVIDTTGGPEHTKWIFVLSPSMVLYIGQKQKGRFVHSSFLAGGATISAGRLVIRDGILEAVWPNSGHYLPTEENFDAFMSFLEQHHIDLHAVKRYTLEEILSATNNFSHENLIMEGPLGKVYLSHVKNLVIQRLDFKHGQGDELQTEISTIKSLNHKNIASISGYCDENDEKIIIHKAFHGTLCQRLSDPTLTWSQRLQICLGVARGLNYIHYDVIHCDINSSKIILDHNWEPKIYGFELSTTYPRSLRHRLLFSRYFDTNNLTPKYDVYSFGVLLLEVLCGRKRVFTNDVVEEELEEIIDPNLRKQMDTQTMVLFTNIAYKCLKQQYVQRPTMDQIVKELEEVLQLQWELQWEHADMKEHLVTKAADEGILSDILKIPLRDIRQATNGFNKACFVGSGGYADVYRAKLDFLNIEALSSMDEKSKDELPKISKTVAIKRISSRVDEQGKQTFLTELKLLSRCKHPNIVSLLGFSRESGEMILVYEYAFKGSLGDYLVSSDKTSVVLPWAQRIQICLDIAHGISYLHTDMEGKPRIIHRDIKSDNILLDENMNAKLADFGLSKLHPTNQQPSTIYSKNIAGTTLYMDPEYTTTGKYKRESDIYSFGVVLFEVLSGKVAYDSTYTDEDDLGLAPIARRRFNEGTIKELIDPKLIEDDDDHIFTLNKGPNQDSFHAFSKIAYQCLAETQAKRPAINVVIKELQNALKLQGTTVVLSRSRLSDIVLATENFAEKYCIGLDAIGTVYKAELDHFNNNNLLAAEGKNNSESSKKRITVAIKRITSRKGGQGKQEFYEEIEMCTSYQHPNIVPLIGFCNEGDEMILVYEHVSERSLNDYLKSVDKMGTFTWIRRLHMCLEIARGLDHLHTKMVNPQRIIHIDIKSGNILLDKNLGPKIAYFVISKLRPATNIETALERNSDIYSFGVVLFEIFCGRVAYDPVYIEKNNKGLAPIACQCFNGGTIESIMDPTLKEAADEDISTSNRGPNQDSLNTFLKIACQCVGEAAKRPTMDIVIKELERAINFHDPKPVEYS
ncbi:putative protein kinase RLK-Pelle-CR4L family [Helianthus annuus]|uniref:non-specific serine/threonine protein kinase n=1 Tax=Helianthus annuus TaxID=4232 RepID=A0A251SFT3_HELAN|nr:uncharacterized protein LOC110908605 [Helianthus annuus]KAF5768415.1 putative protein kinase RLK-Pelle-CR4L family [Helianthus annuus]